MTYDNWVTLVISVRKSGGVHHYQNFKRLEECGNENVAELAQVLLALTLNNSSNVHRGHVCFRFGTWLEVSFPRNVNTKIEAPSDTRACVTAATLQSKTEYIEFGLPRSFWFTFSPKGYAAIQAMSVSG